MNLISQYSLGFYLLCVLLGAVYAFLLYRKDRRLSDFSRSAILTLAMLRMLSVSLIAILLLAPLLKYTQKTVEKPILLFALDGSSSMKNGTDSLLAFDSILGQLQERFQDQYELATYTFDQSLEPWQAQTAFDGKLTNYEALIDGLNSRYLNRNLAGMVLISDGIFNQGMNPLYLTNKINYPIFSLATGDTNRRVDGKIAAVRNNEIAFLGNDFPFETEISVQGAKGEKLSLKVLKGKEVLFSEIVFVDEMNYFNSLSGSLEAKKLGVQKFTVELETLEGEKNVLNNTYDFYLDVLDGRQKIAFLAAAPHPDIAALKESLASNKNYALKSSLLDDFKGDPDDFDLLILHATNPAAYRKNKTLIDKIRAAKVPLLILGTAIPELGGIPQQSLSKKNLYNSALISLNPDFTLFTLSEKLEKQLNRFPPLSAVSVHNKGTNPNSILAHQQIGAVQTNYPLMAFYNVQSRKIACFFADGFWRWRISDYAENSSHQNFNELIRKSVQYLALKSDRSFFRLNVGKSFYENEEIVFDAQLFNQSYELVNDANIKLSIFNREEEEFKFSLNPYKQVYRLKIPSLGVGDYRYRAEVELNQNTYREEGSFVVKALQVEEMEQTANHNLLYQLSEKSSGNFLPLADFEQLPELINQREDVHSVSYFDDTLVEVINLKWILFVLVGLLSLEWFIRKYRGAY